MQYLENMLPVMDSFEIPYHKRKVQINLDPHIDEQKYFFIQFVIQKLGFGMVTSILVGLSGWKSTIRLQSTIEAWY